MSNSKELQEILDGLKDMYHDHNLTSSQSFNIGRAYGYLLKLSEQGCKYNTCSDLKLMGDAGPEVIMPLII